MDVKFSTFLQVLFLILAVGQSNAAAASCDTNKIQSCLTGYFKAFGITTTDKLPSSAIFVTNWLLSVGKAADNAAPTICTPIRDLETCAEDKVLDCMTEANLKPLVNSTDHSKNPLAEFFWVEHFASYSALCQHTDQDVNDNYKCAVKLSGDEKPDMDFKWAKSCAYVDSMQKSCDDQETAVKCIVDKVKATCSSADASIMCAYFNRLNGRLINGCENVCPSSYIENSSADSNGNRPLTALLSISVALIAKTMLA